MAGNKMKYTLYHLDKIGLSLEGMMVFKFQKCYKAHFILLPAIFKCPIWLFIPQYIFLSLLGIGCCSLSVKKYIKGAIPFSCTFFLSPDRGGSM